MSNNKTSADKTAIGFDYQYYFFLWKLLSLRKGQSIGIEVRDDVHTELDNDVQILYQLKHTLRKNKDGSNINLTKLDKDLWKTMSNWVKIISDKNAQRGTQQSQLNFIAKTTFILVSNKSFSQKNSFLKQIADLKEGKTSIANLRMFINQKVTPTSASMKSYKSDVLTLNNNVLKEFLCSTFFELGTEKLIQKCKDEIKADKIPEDRIDDVFAQIDSAIKRENYDKIKKGQKAEITFDEFYMKYRRYYDLARNANTLYKKPYEGCLPDQLEEQTFIKQLIDIKDIKTNDIETITKFTRFKLALETNLEDWVQKGELTTEEKNKFKNNAIILWENKFRDVHNKSFFSFQTKNQKGLKIINYLREKELSISNQTLDLTLSNGTFYYLSDIPKIGWRGDWKTKYKQ